MPMQRQTMRRSRLSHRCWPRSPSKRPPRARAPQPVSFYSRRMNIPRKGRVGGHDGAGRLSALGLETLEGSTQAFSGADRWLVADEVARSADVRQRIANVSGAHGPIDGLLHAARKLSDIVQELIEGRALPARYVDHLPLELARGCGGQQVGAYRIVDVTKVPRLLAVTEDDRACLRQGRGDEIRDDGGILTLRILSRPEDVEVAQAQRLKTVEA